MYPKMTSNSQYYFLSAVIAIYLCSGAFSVQAVSTRGETRDGLIFVASSQRKSTNVGTACAVKPKKSSTSTIPARKARNIRETFFSDLNLHNKEAFDLLNQLWHSKVGWKHVNTKDGVSVERRSLPAGSFVDSADASKGDKHACVRSSGVIKASPQSVIDLFLDNERVSEFNEHVIKVKDIMSLPKKNGDDSWTKLSWAAGPKYGPFKARDFASVVNYKKFQNGTFMIINRPAYHPDYPPSSKYVRATTLLVGNIIEPLQCGTEQHTKLTQVAHVNPGGAGDTAAAAFVINKLCAVGPPSFIRKLEIAAQKSDNIKRKLQDKNFKMPSFKNDFDKFTTQWSKFKIPDLLDERFSKKKKSLVVAFTNSKTNFFK